MSRHRREEGMVLTELLVAMVLMGILLGATLTTFANMERNTRKSMNTSDVMEAARLQTGRLAAELRNLASQADNVSRPIERAEPQDLIFLIVGRTGTPTSSNPTNIQRIRYCLSNQQQLYRQTQTLASPTTAAPPAAACPASGWTQTQSMTSWIVNGTRAVFGYMLAVPPPERYLELNTVTTLAQLESIVGIRTELFVDDSPTLDPGESTLTTRVFLRNQNRKPTAVFSASPYTGMGLLLNGSESEDPEGGRLTFKWFNGANEQIGEGAVVVANLTAGTHQIWLRVTDPAGNSTDTEAQSFTCQPTTGCV